MEIIHSSGDLLKFFYDFVDDSLKNRNLTLDTTTVIYLVGVLNSFAGSENPLREYDGPLTTRLNETLNAGSTVERTRGLREIGDLCLFLTGYFPDYIIKKGSGQMDYHMALGSTAYREAGRILEWNNELNRELADKFQDLSLVIGDLRPLELYDTLSLAELVERWERSQDSYDFSLLQSRGIFPAKVGKEIN